MKRFIKRNSLLVTISLVLWWLLFAIISNSALTLFILPFCLLPMANWD